MPLYEVVFLSKDPEALLFGPKAVVAANDKAAVTNAALIAADVLKDESVDLASLSVLVRPFGGS